MKSVINPAIVTAILMYIFTSMFNKTWNIMQYTQESVFVFGAVTFMGIVIPAMFNYLNSKP